MEDRYDRHLYVVLFLFTWHYLRHMDCVNRWCEMTRGRTVPLLFYLPSDEVQCPIEPHVVN